MCINVNSTKEHKHLYVLPSTVMPMKRDIFLTKGQALTTCGIKTYKRTYKDDIHGNMEDTIITAGKHASRLSNREL